MDITKVRKINLQTFDFNTQAHEFKLKILKLAAQDNIPSDVAAIAICDVLGIIAGKQDQIGGIHTINDRLDLACERIKDTYQRYLNVNIRSG